MRDNGGFDPFNLLALIQLFRGAGQQYERKIYKIHDMTSDELYFLEFACSTVFSTS